jgi:hypothetical protein
MSPSIQVELPSKVRLRMATMVSTMAITSTGVNSRFIFTPSTTLNPTRTKIQEVRSEYHQPTKLYKKYKSRKPKGLVFILSLFSNDRNGPLARAIALNYPDDTK